MPAHRTDIVSQKQRFVITPDTAQAVKDFAMRQSPENKRYFQTYSADGTFSLPGLEKLDDNMFTPSMHAKGTDMRRSVGCGFHAAEFDYPRKGENPDLYDTSTVLNTGEKINNPKFEQVPNAFGKNDKYFGFSDAAGNYPRPHDLASKKDMPDNPESSSEWIPTEALYRKTTTPTTPADKKCASDNSWFYACQKDPKCTYIDKFIIKIKNACQMKLQNHGLIILTQSLKMINIL